MTAHVQQTREAASAAGLLIDSSVADARHLDLPSPGRVLDPLSPGS
jgi:hypothetical protein